jgi:selenocysteine-specific elongation factor
LEELASADAKVRVARLVREAEYGMAQEELIARTGWTAGEVAAACPASVKRLAGAAWFVDEARFASARERLVKAVAEYHKANPLQPGMPKADARARDFAKAPAAVFEALVGASTELVAEAETLRLKTHKVALKQDEEKARAAIEDAFAKAGLAVPGVKETLAQSGVEAARAKTLLQNLLREGKLVKIDNELVFHAGAIAELRGLMAARKGQAFDVPAFKEWTGISRKYAIPLLEYLDREKVTRREGDRRVVL